MHANTTAAMTLIAITSLRELACVWARGFPHLQHRQRPDVRLYRLHAAQAATRQIPRGQLSDVRPDGPGPGAVCVCGAGRVKGGFLNPYVLARRLISSRSGASSAL